MKVRIGDLCFSEAERDGILDVINSERISEGRKVREFENELARLVSRQYAIAVNSGTSALVASLTALKQDPRFTLLKRPKVLTSPLTYIATANSIVVCGMEPVFVDVDPLTFEIIPEQVEAALSQDPSIGAIIPVHLMGYPCAMDSLSRIADRFKVGLVEDAAQAHGSTYRGKQVGSWGHLTAYSFYIAHNIQAGELGAVTTDDPPLASAIRRIKSNGRLCDCSVCKRYEGRCPRIHDDSSNDFDPRFTHAIIGYNFRTTEFSAAIALPQLTRFHSIIETRYRNVCHLHDGLKGLEDILILPQLSSDVSYLGFPIVVRKNGKVSRGRLRRELESRGVETRPLFGCIPLHQPAYASLRSTYEGRLPNAEFLGLHGFYVGCHQYLSKEDIEYVIDTFHEAVRSIARA